MKVPGFVQRPLVSLGLLVLLGAGGTGCATTEKMDDFGSAVFRHGGIAVRSQPSGARIYINEKEVGRSPLHHPARPGIYRVVAKKRGFETTEQWVDVPKRKTVEVRIQLERP